MKTEARLTFVTFVVGATLGLASLPLLVSAHEGGHDHDHDHPSEGDRSDNSWRAESEELEVTPRHEPHALGWPPERLKHCTWRTEATDTGVGGVFAQCELDEVPVGNGLHRILSWTDPHHLVVLGFAAHLPESDGVVDGESLSDAHPDVHGEPPPDNRSAAAYVLMPHARGTGKHNARDGAFDNHTIVTLCCEVSP